MPTNRTHRCRHAVLPVAELSRAVEQVRATFSSAEYRDRRADEIRVLCAGLTGLAADLWRGLPERVVAVACMDLWLAALACDRLVEQAEPGTGSAEACCALRHLGRSCRGAASAVAEGLRAAAA